MIQNRQRRVTVRLPQLTAFLKRVCAETALDLESVAVCLVGDAEIARLNRRFRGKRGPTDVLSFPATNGSLVRTAERMPNASTTGGVRKRVGIKSAAHFIGDIAISPQTARRNARRFGRTLDDELRILMLHGVLHLLGYDHETDDGEMQRAETRLRRRLGIA